MEEVSTKAGRGLGLDHGEIATKEVEKPIIEEPILEIEREEIDVVCDQNLPLTVLQLPDLAGNVEVKPCATVEQAHTETVVDPRVF